MVWLGQVRLVQVVALTCQATTRLVFDFACLKYRHITISPQKLKFARIYKNEFSSLKAIYTLRNGSGRVLVLQFDTNCK